MLGSRGTGHGDSIGQAVVQVVEADRRVVPHSCCALVAAGAEKHPPASAVRGLTLGGTRYQFWSHELCLTESVAQQLGVILFAGVGLMTQKSVDWDSPQLQTRHVERDFDLFVQASRGLVSLGDWRPKISMQRIAV